MSRLGTILLFTLLPVWELGCGSPASHSTSQLPSPNDASKAFAESPVITTLSPGSVRAGSEDLTLTINGSKFDNKLLVSQSIAFWTTDSNLHDHGTMLVTKFVSSSQLTAVIPAALLQNPTSVQIVVLTGDSMGMSDGFFGYPRSNSVIFSVKP